MTAQQAEALPSWTGDTDVDSALIMLDRIDCSHEDDARIDAVTATLRKLHARVQELEAELASERRHSGASNAAAVRTLAAMGYSWHGGEQWEPPVTQTQQERKPLGPYGLKKLIQKLQSELGVWNHGDLVQAVEIHHGIT